LMCCGSFFALRMDFLDPDAPLPPTFFEFEELDVVPFTISAPEQQHDAAKATEEAAAAAAAAREEKEKGESHTRSEALQVEANSQLSHNIARGKIYTLVFIARRVIKQNSDIGTCVRLLYTRLGGVGGVAAGWRRGVSSNEAMKFRCVELPGPPLRRCA
jgi:hypothetical protein